MESPRFDRLCAAAFAVAMVLTVVLATGAALESEAVRAWMGRMLHEPMRDNPEAFVIALAIALGWMGGMWWWAGRRYR